MLTKARAAQYKDDALFGNFENTHFKGKLSVQILLWIIINTAE